MSRKTRLRDAATAATGDDAILDVAEFTPTETDHAFVFGDAGSRNGVPHVELPRHAALAVTPTAVHVLGIPRGFWSTQPADAYRITSIDRCNLEVRVTRRLSDRLLTLIDHSTGLVLELAAGHLSPYQPRVLCELLLGEAPPVDADPA